MNDSDGADDFEVVPATKDDGMQWDVEDEDQDEIKQRKIKREYCARSMA